MWLQSGEQNPRELVSPGSNQLDPGDDSVTGIDWISRISALIIISATAAYLIGFVVVNSYLFTFGMVPYDFLQARYVSAGLLYLASTVGITSIGLFFRYLIRRHYYAADQVKWRDQISLGHTFCFHSFK